MAEPKNKKTIVKQAATPAPEAPALDPADYPRRSRLGFIAGVLPGRMVVPAPTAGLPPILGLTFDSQAAMSEDPTQSAIYELTLSLDVPQVDRKEEPFARMIQTAYELARVMDGAISDDNGQALSEAAIGAIARDLMALYDTLDARDLSAGSPQARRLFS